MQGWVGVSYWDGMGHNVGEGMFLLVVALVESTSVPLRTQAIFLELT